MAEILEYFPWSEQNVKECFLDYEHGKYTILDIELGGQCNYHCIYCDSPSREKKCEISIDKIESVFVSNNIKWVFVCGLGEPTFGDNYTFLLKILKYCEIYNAKCSIFTNLSNLNPEIIKYIDKEILYVLFKYDSSCVNKNAQIYGISSATKQLFNVDKLKKHVIIKDGCTNVAASIVPTSINKNDIIDIVNECLRNNIFPLIADLENSGDAHEYYNQLSVSSEELLSIKEQVEKIINKEYEVPVCPAVMSGIHIRHDGIVTVDEYSGLSCHWFWLEEPKTKAICNFNTNNITDIVEQIENYRISRLSCLQSFLKDYNKGPFGGCGGDINTLLNKYIDISKRKHI